MLSLHQINMNNSGDNNNYNFHIVAIEYKIVTISPFLFILYILMLQFIAPLVFERLFCKNSIWYFFVVRMVSSLNDAIYYPSLSTTWIHLTWKVQIPLDSVCLAFSFASCDSTTQHSLAWPCMVWLVLICFISNNAHILAPLSLSWLKWPQLKKAQLDSLWIETLFLDLLISPCLDFAWPGSSLMEEGRMAWKQRKNVLALSFVFFKTLPFIFYLMVKWWMEAALDLVEYNQGQVVVKCDGRGPCYKGAVEWIFIEVSVQIKICQEE